MKTCGKCKIDKPFLDFYKSKATKDGVAAKCKECAKKDSSVWHKNNLDRHKENVKKFKLENPDYMKRWKKENKKHVQTYQQLWLKETNYTKERCKIDPSFRVARLIRNRLWYAVSGRYKKCKSAVRDLGMSIKDFLVYLNVDAFHKYGIPYTGNESKFHLDHITPLSSFDLSNKEQLQIAIRWDNLQVLTVEENLRKGAKL